ncbi:rhodanese-like domain-containing protein [Nonomuraea sp. NPDC048892]|uniref:rhodanese-like domain-containing protein n=1 Tax=Nonomuraea sp. NPDC048892 TaxID=3154624 RepID=UPI0033F6DE79
MGFTAFQVRALLLRRDEAVIADVREEAAYAQGHPLWAANFPLSLLELDAWRRIPRRDTPVVVYGDADAPARRAIDVLRRLGYTQARPLLDGLDGWIAAGGELFQDVNVPSKAFGELVESVSRTPSLTAQQVGALIDAGTPPVIVDARRFDEFHTMSIPTATSVPGAELVLRIRELAPDPATPVVVNCAGRTRSIIGAQSLINAGLPNPVAALRNGTIGWTLAGQRLDHGATGTAPATVAEPHHALARSGAHAVARRAGSTWAPARPSPPSASSTTTTAGSATSPAAPSPSASRTSTPSRPPARPERPEPTRRRTFGCEAAPPGGKALGSPALIRR